MISSKNSDSKAYNECKFMTTHNSYANTLDPKASITEQLDQGVRGFELDIHDNWTIFEVIKGFFGVGGNFKIGKWTPRVEKND